MQLFDAKALGNSHSHKCVSMYFCLIYMKFARNHNVWRKTGIFAATNVRNQICLCPGLCVLVSLQYGRMYTIDPAIHWIGTAPCWGPENLPVLSLTLIDPGTIQNVSSEPHNIQDIHNWWEKIYLKILRHLAHAVQSYR